MSEHRKKLEIDSRAVVQFVCSARVNREKELMCVSPKRRV